MSLCAFNKGHRVHHPRRGPSTVDRYVEPIPGDPPRQRLVAIRPDSDGHLTCEDERELIDLGDHLRAELAKHEAEAAKLRIRIAELEGETK